MPHNLLVLAGEAGAAEAGPPTGLLLVAGLAAVAFVVGHATRRYVSEVIVFLAIGVVVGPTVLGLVDAETLTALDPVISLALGAIIFGIGQRLEWPRLQALRHHLAIHIIGGLASGPGVGIGIVAALPLEAHPLVETGPRFVRCVTHVPFAKECRLIPGTLQILGKEKCPIGDQPVIVDHAVLVRVKTGQDGSSAGRAQGRRHECIFDVHAV